MMDEVFNQIMAYVVQIFFLILSFAMLYFMRMLKAWMSAKLSKAEQELLRDVASSAVLYVQQRFPQATDGHKLKQALDKADKLLLEQGLQFDAGAMEILIESQLKVLKSNMIDVWSNEPLN